MSTIEFNGSEFHYEDVGTGTPLILVHGSASDSRAWAGQQKEFANHFRTICYSRRYHWPNKPIADHTDYSMMLHVEDLAALIEVLKVAPVHLVGHSYGAFLCMLLAMKEPHLVKSLVLAEPPAITLFVSSQPKPAELIRLMFTRPGTALSIIKFGATGVEPAKKAFRRGDLEAGARIFGDAVFGREAIDHFPGIRRDQVKDNLSNIRAEWLGSGLLPVDDEALRKLNVPVLLVEGECTIPMFRHLVDRLEELLPHTERVKIPNASHSSQEDNPQAYNTAVLEFLQRQGRPAASTT
jgi:non-heme chloroperoxidase